MPTSRLSPPPVLEPAGSHPVGQTANRRFPLPDPDGFMTPEITRVVTALRRVDADIATLAEAVQFDLQVVDIATTATHALPDPRDLANGVQTIVKFVGTHPVQGVCEVTTVGARAITYLTTGPSFFTPGLGEIVRFIVSNGAYIVEILQIGAPFGFKKRGTGAYYNPPASWQRSALTETTGQSVYCRTVGGEHVTIPCHGRYAVQMSEYVSNLTGVSPVGLYLGAGSGPSPDAFGGFTFSSIAVGHSQIIALPTKAALLQRDAAFSQWIYSTGSSHYGAFCILSVDYLGR
jgi:hypothetical protein